MTIRIALRVSVVVLLAGGIWFYALRGPAILLDLPDMSARMLCL